MSKQTKRQMLCRVLFSALVTFAPAIHAPVLAAGTGDMAFRQAVAEASYGSEAVGTFYRLRDYRPIFTGEDDLDRRAALFRALDTAELHGLPVNRYDPKALRRAFRDAESPRALGQAEVEAAKMFVQFAQDIQSGVLEPRRVDPGIVRDLPRRDPVMQLQAFSRANPDRFLRALTPKTREYTALMVERLELEQVVARGGWGPKVSGDSIGPGAVGSDVVALRNRLVAMGYLERQPSRSYDAAIEAAVMRFQIDHGLNPDGAVGAETLAAINISAEKRLSQVLVAMERERWTNIPRGARHVVVNIPEFTARVRENGKTVFSTRVVVGKDTSDRRTPEFSDEMEFLVINPTWSVPRSITTKEYLPMLQRNRNAVSHLKLVDSRGRTVSRGSVNFSQYNARTFPYRLRQPPSKRNALGLVKFMFPNSYNIYLHDTPSKSLFDHDRRAYSHGCVRVGDPFDLAYELLSKQSDDPEGLFQAKLRTGAESRVNLEQPLPVHIMYRTAFSTPKGQMNYRHDIYGRDARIWSALQRAGVSLPALDS